MNGSLITAKDRLLRKQCKLAWYIKNLSHGNIISKANDWKVSGWMGFVNTASQVNRGIDIFVRGKAAESNSLFNLKSTSNIIVGAYLVGEIHTNFLDDEDGDFVSTGRDKVQWESLQGELLESWGQKVVTNLLEKYVKIQRAEKETKLIKKTGFDKWLKTRSPREQRIEQKLVKTIVNDDRIQSDSADPLLEMIKTNIEFDAFQDLVEEIENTGTNVELLMKLVGEWRIIEARKHLMLSDVRLEIISKLDYFVKKRALEVQQIQPIFEDNGWLVNPSWGKVSGQNTYTKLLRQHCPEPTKLDDKDRCIDIVGYDTGGTINIVELKRPKKTLSLDDLNQIEKYRNWAKVKLLGGSGHDSPAGLTSLLIVRKLSNLAEIKEKVDTLASINVRVETYHDLLNRTKRVYGIMEKDLEKITPEYARKQKMKKTQAKKKKLKRLYLIPT